LEVTGQTVVVGVGNEIDESKEVANEVPANREVIASILSCRVSMGWQEETASLPQRPKLANEVVPISPLSRAIA